MWLQGRLAVSSQEAEGGALAAGLLGFLQQGDVVRVGVQGKHHHPPPTTIGGSQPSLGGNPSSGGRSGSRPAPFPAAICSRMNTRRFFGSQTTDRDGSRNACSGGVGAGELTHGPWPKGDQLQCQGSGQI